MPLAIEPLHPMYAADRAALLRDPDLACERMKRVLAVRGIG